MCSLLKFSSLFQTCFSDQLKLIFYLICRYLDGCLQDFLFGKFGVQAPVVMDPWSRLHGTVPLALNSFDEFG